MRSVFGVLAAVGVLATGALEGQTKTPDHSVASVVSRVRQSTVFISVLHADGSGSTGSGVVITSGGTIATAAHVLDRATRVTVRFSNGRELDATGTLIVDGRLDLAVIQVPGFELTPAKLGNSDSVEVGDRLLAVGAPLGLASTVSDGLLSANRLLDGRQLLQLSIPVSPGSSGGPVTTLDGKVVGLIVSGIRGDGAQNLNFALPINYLRGYIPSLDPRRITAFSGAPTTEAAGSSTTSPTGTSNIPNVVNDKLALDFRALDGVSYYESQVANNIRTSSITKYHYSLNPSGRPMLERRVSVTYNQFWTDKAADDIRTELDLDGLASSRSYFVRRTSEAQWNYPSSEFVIGSGSATWNIAGKTATERAPSGTVPAEMLFAVIAALPDSLPPTAYIWVASPAADQNSLSVRVRAARVDFGPVRIANVMIADQGQECGPKTHAVAQPMAVRTATVTAEAISATRTVLASRPHLGADQICLSKPVQ